MSTFCTSSSYENHFCPNGRSTYHFNSDPFAKVREREPCQPWQTSEVGSSRRTAMAVELTPIGKAAGRQKTKRVHHNLPQCLGADAAHRDRRKTAQASPP